MPTSAASVPSGRPPVRRLARGLVSARLRSVGRGFLASALLASLVACGGGGDDASTCYVDCTSGTAAATIPTADALTPVVAVAHTVDTVPVLGSDGLVHVVYEVRLMNTRTVTATVLQVDAVDAASTGRVLGSSSGATLLASLRTLNNRFASAPTLVTNDTRLLLMHLTFANREAVPATITHRLRVLAGSLDATNPNAVDQTYASGPIRVSPAAVSVLGPPLRGNHWVAINGCCDPTSVHRDTGLPVNGDIHFAQRYAIDWMRMSAGNRLLEGDPTRVANYTAYGAEVISVADGVVVGALDTLPDQAPPSLPNPATITLSSADGNHLVVDIGGGRYAFYAHLQPGAAGVAVKVGDRVTRGQRLGLLGNSGNSSAPHLHFHLMDGPSVLGSNGLPFVIEGYAQSGLVPAAILTGYDADLSSGLYAAPRTPTTPALPLDRTIVDFPQ